MVAVDSFAGTVGTGVAGLGVSEAFTAGSVAVGVLAGLLVNAGLGLDVAEIVTVLDGSVAESVVGEGMVGKGRVAEGAGEGVGVV